MPKVIVSPFDPEAQEAADFVEKHYPGFAVFMSKAAHEFEENCCEVLDSTVNTLCSAIRDKWDPVLDNDDLEAIFRKVLSAGMIRAAKR